MNPVEEESEILLLRSDRQDAVAMASPQILADRCRLRHPHAIIEEGRHGTERIDFQITFLLNARWERQHLQFIREIKFLKRPERAERAGAHAVVKRDHPGFL